tara:strand:- start:310 stop:546 length:237 start_codon:yes stop_codon:yes gene_type:complete
MKNLYERLQPEILDSIKADLKIYPHTTKDLIDTLKSVNFWSDLKVQHVNTIINHSHANLISISHMDLLWGDRFLINEK